MPDHRPPVPVNPEPLDALKARFPKALEFVFDAVGIRDKGLIRPGECVANVFDFEDGIRLIVSRELMPDRTRVLHFSASVFDPDRLKNRLERIIWTMSPAVRKAWFIGECVHLWKRLSDDKRQTNFVGFTESEQVAHWCIDEEKASVPS